MRENRLLVSKKGEKFLHKIFAPITFFMNKYSPDLYKEIIKCYKYETRNPSIYGNVICGEMELTKSSIELRTNAEGDENYI